MHQFGSIPTTDYVTKYDHRRDDELSRRLREADEELARRQPRQRQVETPEPPHWNPTDCL